MKDNGTAPPAALLIGLVASAIGNRLSPGNGMLWFIPVFLVSLISIAYALAKAEKS